MAHEQKTVRGKKTEKRAKLAEMRIRPAENGGHSIEHHFEPTEGGQGFKAPETHVFGANEGMKMLGHIADHLNVEKTKGGPAGDGKDWDDEDEDYGDAE